MSVPKITPLAVDRPGTTSEEFIPTEAEPVVRLYTKTWIPPGVEQGEAPQAALLFIHGFLDHASRYDHIFPYLASKGILVICYDQRGYGETANRGMSGEWKHNHTNTTLELLAKDLDFMLRHVRAKVERQWGAVPFFLMGHSMGGQLALTALTRPQGSTTPARISAEAVDGLAGLVAMAPWLKLTSPPPRLLFALAPHIARRLPHLWWKSPLKPEEFSKDPAAVAAAAQDPCMHPWVYLSACVGPLLNGPDVLEDKVQYFPKDVPLLIIHGDADPVTWYEGSKSFVERVGAQDKTLATMPGHLHEPLQEVLPERTEAVQLLADWILTRASAKRTDAPIASKL